MARSKPPWWQLPALITAGITATGAIGTGIVMAAKWISLPDRVEAGEQKNVQQDKQIDRLITLQEYYQQQQVQRPPVPGPPVPPSRSARENREWVEQDQGVCWRCLASEYDQCWEDDPETEQEDNRWRQCD